MIRSLKIMIFIISSLLTLTFSLCTSSRDNVIPHQNSIDSIYMNLSAFGVESDSFPTITVYVNFLKDTSYCQKSYYNPAIKGSTYKLTHAEIKKLLLLLRNASLEKLLPNYEVGMTDQPTSTTTIYTRQKKYTIRDYGLEGDPILQEAYKIVYKL